MSKPVVAQSFTFDSVPVAQTNARGVVGGGAAPAQSAKRKGPTSTNTHSTTRGGPTTHHSPPQSASSSSSRNPQSRRYNGEAPPTATIEDGDGPSESEVRALLLQASKMRDSLHSAVKGSRNDGLPDSPKQTSETRADPPSTPNPVSNQPPISHSDPEPPARLLRQTPTLDDEVVCITEDDLTKIDDPETLAFLEANSGWLVRYMHQGGAVDTTNTAKDGVVPSTPSTPPPQPQEGGGGDGSGAFFLTAVGTDGKEYHVCMHDDNPGDLSEEGVPPVSARAPSVASSYATSVASRRQLQIPLGMLPPDVHKKHPRLFSDPSRYHRRSSSVSLRSSVVSVSPAGMYPPHDGRDDSVVFGDMVDDDHDLLEQELADVNAALYGTILLRKEQDYNELPDTPEAMLNMLEAQAAMDESLATAPVNVGISQASPVGGGDSEDCVVVGDGESNYDDRRAISSVLDRYAALDEHESDGDDDDALSSVAPTSEAGSVRSTSSSKASTLRNRESLKARREKISELLDLLQDRNRKAREVTGSTPRSSVSGSIGPRSDHDSAIQRLIGQTFVTQVGGGSTSSDLNASMNSIGSSASSAMSYASSGGVTDEQLDELRSVGEEAFARRLDALRQKHALKRQKELDDINKEWLRQQEGIDPTLPEEDNPTSTPPPAQGQPASNRSAFSIQHCGRRNPPQQPAPHATAPVPPSPQVQEGIDRAAARAQGKKLTDSESRRVEFLLEAYGKDDEGWYETPEQRARREEDEAATQAKMAEVEKSLERMQAVRDRVLKLRSSPTEDGGEPVSDHKSVRALNLAMGVSDSVSQLLKRLEADETQHDTHTAKLDTTTTKSTDGAAVDQRKVLGNKYLADVAEEKRRKARLKALNDELDRIQQSVNVLTTAPYSFLKSSHADPAQLYAEPKGEAGPLSAHGGMPESLPEGTQLPDERSIQALVSAARQEDTLWGSDTAAAITPDGVDDRGGEAVISGGDVVVVPYVPSHYQESLRDRLQQASAAAEECAKISDDYLQKYEIDYLEEKDYSVGEEGEGEAEVEGVSTN